MDASTDPLGGAGAHQGMQLINKNDDVLRLHDLLHDRLHTRFELAAVLRAGHQRSEVQRHHAAVEQQLRHFAVDDALRQALHDGRLADARLANEYRIVLRSPAQDLYQPFNLVLAPDDRI